MFSTKLIHDNISEMDAGQGVSHAAERTRCKPSRWPFVISPLHPDGALTQGTEVARNQRAKHVKFYGRERRLHLLLSVSAAASHATTPLVSPTFVPAAWSDIRYRMGSAHRNIHQSK